MSDVVRMRKEWVELDLDEIVSIVGHWGITVTSVEAVRAVYKIVSPGGVVALKGAGSDEAHVNLVSQVNRYLAGRGFTHLAPYMPNLNGDYYLRWGDRFFAVTPWCEGREPDYTSAGEMESCLPVLAEFHVAGMGFTPHGVKIGDRLGKTPERLRSRAHDLELFLEGAKASSQPDEFERRLVAMGPTLLRQANLSYENLNRVPYEERCEWGRQARPLIHGDPSERNFIVGQGGSVWLLDLDSVTIDLPESDLWRLTRRMLRRVHWDLDSARKVLSAYSAVTPFGHAEKAILLALLQFPERAWRLCKTYYGRKDDDEGDFSPERLTLRLHELERDMPRWLDFLRDYARVYEVPGLRLN